MLNNLGLGFIFTARDLASGVFTQLEVNFTRLDRRVGLGTARIEGAFQRLGVAMALFSAGAVTIGASLSLANTAGQFEQAVAGVAAVSGASAEVLGQLRDAAIKASLATQFTCAYPKFGRCVMSASKLRQNARHDVSDSHDEPWVLPSV
ncbi:hypothetical protein SAMN05443572_1119 [Myxococcus fulvus]|uniref:Uncharacterized protein n=1 Tax=Myxococcus fulvus TaxID=33 RepID=A0A511TEQ6_MYXFU|nr:hypothetical protein [Myxococcus fulvus]GEN12641.1 hypothetical protein MFU01_76780 [Myxococcus fulvus]SEU35787.1 hypothetical protein SAMN05443572_1119 [Myxococcus fulvus]